MHDDGPPAEAIDLDAQLRKLRPRLERPRRLICAEIDGLRDQKSLPLDRPLLQPLLELLEEDALMQCVLIDDEHALGRFEDEVRVVDLKRGMRNAELGRGDSGG